MMSAGARHSTGVPEGVGSFSFLSCVAKAGVTRLKRKSAAAADLRVLLLKDMTELIPSGKNGHRPAARVAPPYHKRRRPAAILHFAPRPPGVFTVSARNSEQRGRLRTPERSGNRHTIPRGRLAGCKLSSLGRREEARPYLMR